MTDEESRGRLDRWRRVSAGDSLGRRQQTVDTVMVFEFSASTWNPHRLHYDADYARDEEGRPGTLVPGPLQGALLEELASSWAEEHGAVVTSLRYRHGAPALVGHELVATGEVESIHHDRGEATLGLWIEADGERTTVGSATVVGGPEA